MKKFWMISMLLIAALFVIRCGDGENENDGGNEGGNNACTEQGAFRCNGDMLQKCDQETWKNFENCAGKTCNATAGTCEDGGNTEPTTPDDGGDTNPTTPDDGDTAPEPTNPGQTGLICGEIYQCMVDCGEDQTCAQNCYDQGSADGQSQIYALIQCMNGCYTDGMSDEDYSACINSQCTSEISNCEGLGGGEAPDTNYNSPYGSVSLNFSIDQIANSSDGQTSQVGIATAAFATGTYGNSGSMSITPADAYMIQSAAMYYNESQGSGVQVQQIPVYVQGNQGVGGNPLVILDIPEENAAVGELKVTLYQGGQAMLYVVNVDWNTQQISCFHAFGEGTLNVNNIGDIANHGPLSFTGNITLFSPKNYDGNGDISSQLGVAACDPIM